MLVRWQTIGVLWLAGCSGVASFPGTSGSTGAATRGSSGARGSSGGSTGGGSSGGTSSGGSTGAPAALPGYPNLALPPVGAAALTIVTPTILELSLVTTKAPDPSPLAQWAGLVADGGVATLPPPTSFAVSVNGAAVPVTEVGFRRRPLYAPLSRYDLRLGNYLYLETAAPLPDGASVSVTDLSGALFTTPYAATVDPGRFGPALHVNQTGYQVGLPKKAQVGYYTGTLPTPGSDGGAGELGIAPGGSFSIVDVATGAAAYSGTLTLRQDVGFPFQPAQYQDVLEADFTPLDAPGTYQLVVPGLGASLPFWIDPGIAMAFARTYAAGMFNQRCGNTARALPYTRFVDGPDHLAPAAVPDAGFAETNALIAANAQVPPGQTAPELISVDTSLYPFVRAGLVDVHGGHHDAGDYSKYLMDSATLVHTLVFAADDFPGVGAMDDLGIPESGDGLSDVLQEAKWEADFILEMQDGDGAFSYLVYPRDRAYESDVLPSHGDPQVIWPKNSFASAAAVAALAEIGSSPLFAKQFPQAAASYLQAARNGWTFLEGALAAHPNGGEYQFIYQDFSFLDRDVLAWAAAALFAATGDPSFQAALEAAMPDPTAASVVDRWGWWGMWGGWGGAARDYAFAGRSGRLPAASLDSSYLALCDQAIAPAGQAKLAWSAQSAYGTTLPGPTKNYGQVGWYFSGTQAFDLAVAAQVDSANAAAYAAAVMADLDYEGGANPVNVSFLEGLGWIRPRELVSQFFQNDRHRLPPTGIDRGNVDTGFAWVDRYGPELEELTFPPDGAAQGSYALYDRFAHEFNTSTEADTVNEGWGFAAAAWLAGSTPAASQPWTAEQGTIALAAGTVPVGSALSATFLPADGGVPLDGARVSWEAQDQEPWMGGTTFAFTPPLPGPKWVDAEAMLPDGRRVVAATPDGGGFWAVETVPAAQLLSAFDPQAASDPTVAAWYRFGGSLADSLGHFPALSPSGAAALDGKSFVFPGFPGDGSLRSFGWSDGAQSPAASSLGSPGAVSVEAMVFVNARNAYGKGNGVLLALTGNWQQQLVLLDNEWNGLTAVGGQSTIAVDAALSPLLAPGSWHFVKLSLDASGYAVTIDGTPTALAAPNDLALWAGATPQLQVGGLDGWLAELVVRG
ncbi:MAG: glycoside hydrolase family 9 protein [Myxococcales bacterium]